MAKAAILGFGTVGSGVYEILKNKNFVDAVGEDVEVKYILDIRDFDDEEVNKYLTHDFNDILNDKEVTVVAEVMGGLHPAYEFTKQLIESKKSVVTSNKELVATYGPELLELAKENNVSYMFEASVGGGIPVIRPMTICTKANDIVRIAGILNGTTNYILNEMFEKGKSFEDALKDAQEKGYAEKNPSADVDGHDACRKLAILSSLAWGKFVDFKNIPTKGITKISLEDVKYARSMDSVIKLIGYADLDENGKIYATVSPMIVSKDILLSGVNDVFNAVMIKGNFLGDAVFYGRGAGKLPTASAVVADVLDCVRHFDSKKHNILWDTKDKYIMSDSEGKLSSFFVRSKDSVDDIKKIFGDVEFISAIDGQIVFIAKNITDDIFNLNVEKLNSVISVIRILEA